MNPAEENAILSGKPMTLGASGHRRGAMTLILFLLAALIALASGLAGPTGASAKTPGVPQNRVWENSARMLQSRPIQMAQSLELQRENSLGRYDSALGDTLAAKSTVVNEGASPVTGYTWNQVLQARYGATNVEWAAPKIPSTPLTLGVLRTPAGDFDLASGWNGYGGLMTEGAPGFNIVTRTHVEGQAAALMQRQGINEGILYMNNPEMCRSCVRFLPRMLQPGRSLQIVFPDGSSTWIQGSTR